MPDRLLRITNGSAPVLREIAEALVLSVRTVERHIENVYNRLGISGRAGRAIVTAYALRHGLITPA